MCPGSATKEILCESTRIEMNNMRVCFVILIAHCDARETRPIAYGQGRLIKLSSYRWTACGGGAKRSCAGNLT